MATIYIDDKSYEVAEGQNLLQAAESLGLDLPYFCWHPALGSVGACRQCAVIQFKDENDDTGKLVMACMTPVADNLRISIRADRVVKFRASVIEWLMTNHPHDCPVCDEGGECHLQDMTVMTGHNYRRHRFPKRTFRNQDLGPFIFHEMNRCITCYRCVRFYDDFAGGTDLMAIGGANHVYFGRESDGVLENEFSGNLVEVCPTGVFTDKTLRRHYARKWDLQSAPSVCAHCSLGCNTLMGSRYDKPVRILNRYHPDINGYFLCDRGRFGYDFMNSSKRVRELSIKDTASPASHDVISSIAAMMQNSQNVIGIGSPRASLESNYALKQLVGAENYSVGISGSEYRLLKDIIAILNRGPAPAASLKDIAAADAVFILGEDITQTAPMMALYARQAVRNKPMQRADKLKIPRWNDMAVRDLLWDDRGPLYIAAVGKTKLDDVATKTRRAAPDDIARLGFAVAAFISDNAPKVENLPDDDRELAKQIAGDLKNSENPVIISGTSLFNKNIISAAANIATALQETGVKAGLAFATGECNSIGACMVAGMDIETALDRAAAEASTVIVLENDLYRRIPANKIDEAFNKIENLVIIDSIEHDLSSRAAVLLPAAAYADGSGTIVNNAARAQRSLRAIKPAAAIQEGWRWCADIRRSIDADFNGWNNLDEISRELFNAVDFLKGKYNEKWSPQTRIEGSRIARSPRPYTGRTAMHANINVHEQAPPVDIDSPLAFSMEGFHGTPPESLTPYYWAPGWNSVQSLNKFQEHVGGDTIGGDSGVRLLNPVQEPNPQYIKDIPGAFQKRTDALLVVPIYHIFGSEKLSSYARDISKLIPDTYAAISKKTAEAHGIKENDTIHLRAAAAELSVPVKIIEAFPHDIAGLPAGIVNLPPAALTGFFDIVKDGG